MMKPVRIGVIGVGRMGQHHCRVLANLRGGTFAGVYDTNPVAAMNISQKYGVPHFRDLEELLRRVDAVIIATPTDTHFKLLLGALEHGVHVLVEKPLAGNVEEAAIMTQYAERSGLIVQVGHIERFNPTFSELKKVLEPMQLLAATFRRLSPYKYSNTDVDVVLDLMTHDVDLMVDLFGAEPSDLSAYGVSVFTPTVDHAVANARFSLGPIATLVASRVTEHKIRAIDVTTAEAYIEADLLNKSIAVHHRSFGEYVNQNRSGITYRQESVIERIVVPNLEPLLLEIEHFADCIIENKIPSVSARESLRAVRLATQFRELASARLASLAVRESLLTHMGVSA